MDLHQAQRHLEQAIQLPQLHQSQKESVYFKKTYSHEPKDDSKKILGNSIKEMKQRGDAHDMFATIYRNEKEIKVPFNHTYFHEAKNEENKILGLLSLEEQAELIADAADRLQRLKELAEDEALALKLQEEEEKGEKRKKGGKKRACS